MFCIYLHAHKFTTLNLLSNFDIFFSFFTVISPLFDEIVRVLEFPLDVSTAEVNLILWLILTDFVNLVVADPTPSAEATSHSKQSNAIQCKQKAIQCSINSVWRKCTSYPTSQVISLQIKCLIYCFNKIIRHINIYDSDI
jgi:hypothetical protein